ncbi:dipeptide epimerase, partial [Escherichia coli]
MTSPRCFRSGAEMRQVQINVVELPLARPFAISRGVRTA